MASTMHGLTDRQNQCLDIIKTSMRERGFPPTLREIGKQMGIRSTNGVNDHLRALERKGFLTREDMASRGIRLMLDDGYGVLNREVPEDDHGIVEIRVYSQIPLWRVS